MTISSTLLASFTLSEAAYNQLPFTEIRCNRCSKLIGKWLRYGVACFEYKCPRCSHRDLINLST